LSWASRFWCITPINWSCFFSCSSNITC
jgi:hypothetical protein